MARIQPVDPPYTPDVQKLFDLAMPEGMDPIELFRVMARSERLLPRFMRAGVLDRGPVPIRDREIVIHRTTARCRAEYEWGVHVAAFWRPLEMGEDVLRAVVHGAADDPAFDERQQALVRLCDELHDTSTLSQDAWDALARHFDELQILELIYTVGMYHTVSFLVNALDLEGEPFGARFAELDGRRAQTGLRGMKATSSFTPSGSA
jgi:alkylhydroperoxidase family enzyme